MGEAINTGMAILLGTQAGYAIAVLVLWGAMLDWYEWGYFEDTGSSGFLKAANGFLFVTMGFGYWTAKRLDNLGAFGKRLYFFGYFLLYIIAAIIFYMVVSRLVLWLEDVVLDLIIAIYY